MHAHLKNFLFSLESPLYCSINSPVRGEMLQTFYKLNLKLKTILKLKGALPQIRDDLPQTFENSPSDCV